MNRLYENAISEISNYFFKNKELYDKFIDSAESIKKSKYDSLKEVTDVTEYKLGEIYKLNNGNDLPGNLVLTFKTNEDHRGKVKLEPTVMRIY